MLIIFAAQRAAADVNAEFNALKELPPAIELTCDKDLVRLDSRSVLSCKLVLPEDSTYDIHNFNVSYSFYRASNSNMNDAEKIQSGGKTSCNIKSDETGIFFYRCNVLFETDDMNFQLSSPVVRTEFYKAGASVSYNVSLLELGCNEVREIKAGVRFRFFDDKGTVNYQWYKSYSRSGALIRIDGANAKTLLLHGDSEEGTVYYLCDAANVISYGASTHTYSSISDDSVRVCVDYTGLEVQTAESALTKDESASEPESESFSLPEVTLPLETSTLEALSSEEETAETLPLSSSADEPIEEGGINIWIVISAGAALIIAVAAAILTAEKKRKK